MESIIELTAQIENIYGIKCQFQHDEKTNFVDRDQSIHIYRIIQEAIHNAIKHGKAKQIDIKLYTQNNTKVLTIYDNGIGFPKILEKKQGMGLTTMYYRAKVLDASFDIKNDKKGGTNIVCIIPEIT